MDNKILVSILTHRCQCPHDRLKRGGDRGGATNIHKRKLSSEPHVKKRYKLGNHLFHTPAGIIGSFALSFLALLVGKFRILLSATAVTYFFTIITSPAYWRRKS
jgi:hypothetical protein